MMKKTGAILLALLPTMTFAQSDQAVADRMIQITSSALYVNEYCGVKIDKEKFKEIAKIFAFSEGMDISKERIEWESLIIPAREEFNAMSKKYPNGSRCEHILKRAEGVLPMINSGPIVELEPEK